MGDWLAFKSGLGLPGAVALSSVALVIALLIISGVALRRGIIFRVVVACVHTWGTNVCNFLSDIVGLLQVTAAVAAYNFGRQLKTLKGLTPYEFICKRWVVAIM